jgi:hypothetical protein
MNQIDIIDILQVPRVQWLSADDRHATKHHQAVMRMVKQLVAEVWERIPWVARRLIAYELQCVHVVHNPDWGGGGHERGTIGIKVADYDNSPNGQSLMRVILAHEFAHSLIYFLAASAAGGNPKTGHLPAARQGKPGYEWFAVYMGLIEDKNEEGHRFTERLADALMLAWGFGEDWAAALDLGDIRNPYAGQSQYLEPEIGKMHHILQRRLAQERP